MPSDVPSDVHPACEFGIPSDLMKLGQEIVPFHARGLRLHVLQASQLLYMKTTTTTIETADDVLALEALDC